MREKDPARGIIHGEWVTPIRKDFAGYTVHEIPPNGQGISALMALGIFVFMFVQF